MKLNAIDIHAHLHTTQADAALTDAGSAFGTTGHARSTPETLLEYYRSRNMGAVIFDVDKEVASGQPIDNRAVADLARQSEGLIIGFASVDPRKGPRALVELERCAEMGLRGLKVQPITQEFQLGDRIYYPLWDFCQEHQWPLMVHTGTTGIGAGSPGGRGLKLKYGRPVPDLDDVAADFPRLNIVAAHFGWPWHLELLAVARHKANVYVDLSGWSPKYIPAEVLQYMNSVIPDKFVFGSDYPLLKPERWLADFDKLTLKDGIREKILLGNASRLLGWEI